MSYILTVRVLVDKPILEDATSSINALLEFGNDNIDWIIDSTEPLSDVIGDAIANDTYDEGDAFK